MAALPLQVNLIPGYNHVPPVVKLNQYEFGLTRQFDVFYGDVAYTIPENSEIRFEGTKPDGKGFTYNTGISYSTNRITVTIKQQMTACAGRYYAELIIIPSTSRRIATINVIMDVERAALNESTDISQTQLPAIIDLAQTNATAAANSATEARNSATAAANSASAAASSETDAESAADRAAQLAAQANTSKNAAADSATAAANAAQGIIDHENQTKDYMDAAELAANRAQLYCDITIPGLRVDVATMNLIEDEDYDRLYFTYNSSNGQLSYNLTS